MVLLLLLSFGIIVIIDIWSQPVKATKAMAEDRARECIRSWQLKLSRRGYSFEDGKVAAVMQCTQELEALKQYDKK